MRFPVAGVSSGGDLQVAGYRAVAVVLLWVSARPGLSNSRI